MCVYVGAIVNDRRFPETNLGKVVFINQNTKIAILETDRGWSCVPTYMIEVKDNARKDQ